MMPSAGVLAALMLAMLASSDEDASRVCSDRSVCSRGEEEEAALLQKASVQRIASIAPGASSATTSSAAKTAELVEPLQLNFVYYKSSSNPFWGMAVELEVPSGTGGPQQMLIDTGSAEIAFCNKTLAEGLTPAAYPEEVLLSIEGCSEESAIGKPMLGAGAYGGDSSGEWWWGYNYVGDIFFGGQDSQGTFERQRNFENVTFAVMQAHKRLTCEFGFDGIWGVAFVNGGAEAFVHTEPSTDPALVLCARGASLVDPPDLCENRTEVIESLCGPVNYAPGVAVALGEANFSTFGIYLDVDGMNWTELQNGTTMKTGNVYLGKAAMENSHYKAGAPNVVPTTTQKVHNTSLSDNAWNLPLAAIRVKSSGPEAVFTAGKELNCGEECYIDSGTPTLSVPGCVGDAVGAVKEDANATLEMVVAGSTPEEQVVLVFPIRDFFDSDGSPVWWVTANSSACYSGTGTETTNVVLGLPTWFYYYVVFDYGTSALAQSGAYKGSTVYGVQVNTTATFVKKP